MALREHQLLRKSYAWELEKDRCEVRVRVEGQLAFNNVNMIVRAAEAKFGLGFDMDDK